MEDIYVLVDDGESLYILDSEVYPTSDNEHPGGMHFVYRWYPLASPEFLINLVGEQNEMNTLLALTVETSFLTATAISLSLLHGPETKAHYYVEERKEPDGTLYKKVYWDQRISRRWPTVLASLPAWMSAHIVLLTRIRGQKEQ